MERNEKDLIEAAKREFREETGCTLPASVAATVVMQNNNYALVRYEISGLPTVAQQARFSVGRHPADANKPQSLQVKDWELSDAEIVPRTMLNTISAKEKPLGRRLRPRSIKQESIRRTLTGMGRWRPFL